MIVLWVILWIFAAVLGLILLLVLLSAVPIRYRVKARQNKNTDVEFRANYLFGLLRLKIFYIGGELTMHYYILFFKFTPKFEEKAIPPEEESTKETKKTAPQKKESFIKKLTNTPKVLTELRVKTIIDPLLQLSKKIFKILWPKRVDISGTVGFSCPYHTGLFFALYETLAGTFGIRKKIRLAGDFNTDETVVRLDADIRGSVSLFRLAIPSIQFILKKDVRTFIRRVIS